ncbi:hypothetical protein RRG08_020179 [Elysia crispata]|uniref:Semaphorin-2A n=1 Tax=Elysia crispata TaxID=231223 RepID=A0AAE0YPD7_9GAST|nr:hypothetical protein RRG08_020179 [Elysia crispata]
MLTAMTTLTLWTLVAVLVGPIRGQSWKYQPIGEGWQSDWNMEEENTMRDYRFIKYSTMIQTGSLFQNENLVSFVQLVVDEDREQLLVGGRDILYRLDLKDLSVLEMVKWESDEKDIQVCSQRGQERENCHNFIRVLSLVDMEAVLVCGTNAFKPTCTLRDVTQLSNVTKEFTGGGICPYSPHYNSTALMTNSGDIYAATVIDFDARDPSISRRQGPSNWLRTHKSSKFLDEPNFVSAYEIGNYIYFFFRETAVEYINCGKRVFSRVARVCKSDKGGPYYLKDMWSSFQKARLNCSLPGQFPFYFDELQSTYYSEDENLIYAVFSTPANSIPGSAVCVYNISSLNTAFEGPFKQQKTHEHAWLRQDTPLVPNKCTNDNNAKRSSRTSELDDAMLTSTTDYQLMDLAVMSRELGPLIMRENERWTHIAVDHVFTKTQKFYDVVFLATDDGKVRKMVHLPESKQTCLIEEIKIVENGHPRPVKNMKISLTTNALYINTRGNVIKVPVQRCFRFTTARACIRAQDPYCAWDPKTETCTKWPAFDPESERWEQDFRGCPVLDDPVNGKWSDWSAWSVCSQVGLDRMVDHCLCRSRTCDKPKPAFKGTDCTGASMEVMNCTVHGQWAEWSAWGACDHTCGMAWRKRHRQCGNPPPKFGGRMCQGDDEQTEYCEDTPACPLVPVDGNWSLWSGWSTCTSNCNGGMQTRKRGCDNPIPMRNGKYCLGNNKEWRLCNVHECPEIGKNAPWTEWIVTNQTSGGYWRQRFRFKCRANVETSKSIKTSFVKAQTEFCHLKEKNCYKKKALANSVTNIDTFTSIDQSLHKYCRYRRRLFRRFCRCRTLGVFLVCKKCGLG